MVKPKIHIGLVTWNRLDLTKICLTSLLENTKGLYHLTIVDNGSTDGTQEYLKGYSKHYTNIQIHCLRRNMGVAVASNLAWDEAAEADYFIKIDNDVEFLDPLWMERLVHMLQNNSKIGPVGYKLCSWHTGKSITLDDGSSALAIPSVNGACICISSAMHREVGFWNESYGQYGLEDLDYNCRATVAGYTPVYAEKEGAVLHHGLDPVRIDWELERRKLTSRLSKNSGEMVYLIYEFLFESKILPVNIKRKYIPVLSNNKFVFKFNQEFKSTQSIVKDLLNTVSVKKDGDKEGLDLTKWKDQSFVY
ncbi:MAG: glycosyltransferase family 2 protein [Desulfovibrio sp.]|nr:glycosyltransferase family 2 protein [Desulfovibrio sp.]